MASRFRGLGFRGISMKRAADQGITFTDRVPGPGSLALKRQGCSSRREPRRWSIETIGPEGRKGNL